MIRIPVRTVRMFGSVLVLCGILPFTVSGQKPAAADQESKFVSLTVGETTHVAGPPEYFERVLLAPPDEEKMSIGNTWEISTDIAIKLGLLKGEQKTERWRVIRRNLGLAQDEKEDLILWTEVVDAILDRIGTLSLPKNILEEPTFGLRVEFPGKDTANAKAAVALTFGKDVDGSLNNDIADVLTGVEGFVNIVDSNGKTEKDQAIVEKALRSTKLRLIDGQGKEYPASPNSHGYFRFERLPVDRDFGSDFWLEATIEKDKSLPELLGPERLYVPVRKGVRTRLSLTAVMPKAGNGERSGSLGIPGAPAPISMMLEQFVSGNFLLSAIMQRLPANPGLHLGMVEVNGSGLQPLWSARFRLQSPALDRRPHFVSKGMIRLQCLSPTNPQGMARPYYVKITWIGRAEAAQLDLQGRSVLESPWGFGVGVVPSINPVLYAVGASYKLISPVEVFAGVGIRKGHSTSFVYGITLDIEDILSALFGEVPAKSDQKSETTAADGQKTESSGTTPASAGKSKKK